MGNRKPGKYDPGAVSERNEEASIAMQWANVLRGILMARGHKVVRTRKDEKDEAPVSKRASIAKEYGGEIMLSIHCNAATGTASGSECIYRGAANKAKAAAISAACAKALGIKDRGPKVEADSQHARLAVMAFQPCFLLELGFIDNPKDLDAMLDQARREAACQVIADLLES